MGFMHAKKLFGCCQLYIDIGAQSLTSEPRNT